MVRYLLDFEYLLKLRPANDWMYRVPELSHTVTSLKQFVPLVPPKAISVVELTDRTKWSFLADHVGEREELVHEKADASPERIARRSIAQKGVIAESDELPKGSAQ